MTHSTSPDRTAHNLSTAQTHPTVRVPSAVVATKPAPAAPPLWAGEPRGPHPARWGVVPATEGRGDLQDDDLSLLPPDDPETTERPGRLLLMARLFATLGPRVDDGSWLAPTAVTVLAVPPGLAERVERALKRLVPHTGPHHEACTVLRIGDTSPGKGAQARFSASVRKALDQAEPVIVLISSPAELEPSLRAALPAPLPLAPVTPEIVREVIASVFPEDLPVDEEEPHGSGRTSDAPAEVAGIEPKTAENLEAASGTEAMRAGSDAMGSDGPHADLSLPDAAEAVAALRDRVRSRAATAVPTLDDIAGYGEAETAARRLVADLDRWARGEVPWRDMTRSLLLEGEPGTGKTFLARAIGASAGVPFHASSLAEWQTAGHLGDTLRAMQTAFAAARAQVPAILFIDEIDSLGTRGGRDTHGSSYRAQVINAFLAEVDGVRDMKGVVLIGATNDAAALDPAIVRPGRFDRTVRVPRPGPAAVRKILAQHLRDDIPRTISRPSCSPPSAPQPRLPGALPSMRPGTWSSPFD